jgi:hypothetical protein
VRNSPYSILHEANGEGRTDPARPADTTISGGVIVLSHGRRSEYLEWRPFFLEQQHF